METPLRQRRQRLGLKQIDLALKAGVNPSAVNRYEKGCRPNRETAAKLARALDCAVGDLFPNTDLRPW